jgi:hypothetical protein
MKKLRIEFRSFLKNFSFSNVEEYTKVLLKASSHNTYVETISNKADSLHYNISKDYVETLNLEYYNHIKKRLRSLRLSVVDVIADITDDSFYGKSTGLYIHNWTGEDGIVGKYLYLVAGILFRNKILPFYVAILRIGSFKAELLGKIVDLCNNLQLKVRLMKLDRGFYSGEVIDELGLRDINYLIFAKKSNLFKCMFEATDKSLIVKHEIKYKKSKSSHIANTNIALVKDVDGYDWVFATNLLLADVRNYVKLYKQRWNIETMFRVHDEAKIKTKSIIPIIRLFYFMLSMLLLFIWNLYAKTLYAFKECIIMLDEISNNVVTKRAY